MGIHDMHCVCCGGVNQEEMSDICAKCWDKYAGDEKKFRTEVVGEWKNEEN